MPTLKQRLRAKFPELRSSHLSEAIAAGAGYKSHIAYLVDTRQPDPPTIPFERLDIQAMATRLETLVPGSDNRNFGGRIKSVLWGDSIYSTRYLPERIPFGPGSRLFRRDPGRGFLDALLIEATSRDGAAVSIHRDARGWGVHLHGDDIHENWLQDGSREILPSCDADDCLTCCGWKANIRFGVHRDERPRRPFSPVTLTIHMQDTEIPEPSAEDEIEVISAPEWRKASRLSSGLVLFAGENEATRRALSITRRVIKLKYHLLGYSDDSLYESIPLAANSDTRAPNQAPVEFQRGNDRRHILFGHVLDNVTMESAIRQALREKLVFARIDARSPDDVMRRLLASGFETWEVDHALRSIICLPNLSDSISFEYAEDARHFINNMHLADF